MDFNCPLKDRFYGADLIKGNPDLLRLEEALGAESTHDFHFRASFKNYQEAWAVQNGYEGDCCLARHLFSDLPNAFRCCYDIGDDWEFRCKPYKRKAKREEGEDFILPEGKGQGIWEDNITVLLSYPGGEIPVTAPRKMRKKEFISPELSGQVLRGFDLPLDIEKTNKTIKINYPLDYEGSKKAKRRISRSITLA